MDFQQFKQQSRNGNAEPPDGSHTAILNVAKVGTSKTGDPLVILEWQTADLAHYWTSYHGSTGPAMRFTRQALEGLGLDVDSFDDWQQVDQALGALTDQTFQVKVQRNGEYLNTYVTGRPDDGDIPVPRGKPVYDDEGIPF